MTAFEFLSVALSFVLGLSVTLLLTSLLAAFRARHETRLDWLPFVWAGYVLVYQFQYWWAVFELSVLPRWTILTFGVLLLLAMILFLAGGLVLPAGSDTYPSDLRAFFERDGRWGVLAIASYSSFGIVGNVLLFKTPLLTTLHLVQVPAIVLALVVATTRRRSLRVAGTLAFGVLLGLMLILATPFAY